MMIQPLRDNVIIEPKSPEEMTKSGIIIPDTADQKRPEQGTVVAVGPGKKVLIDKGYGAPDITNDGVSIAKEIDLKDKVENMGAELVKDVASRTNDVAGDGTTTATILAQAIINEGIKNLSAGANPRALKRGIDKAVEVAVEEIQKLSKKISGNKEDIAQVAVNSADDEEMGQIIAEVMSEVGKDGVVTVEEGQTFGLSK